MRYALIWSIVVFAAVPASAQEKDRSARALALVKEYLEEKKAPPPLATTPADFPKLFPDHSFVFVTFRQFPVARALPEGLSASNVMVIADGRDLSRILSARELEGFFRKNLVKIENEGQAKAVLDAWLRITKEFRQDGMFQFEVLQKEFGVDNRKDLTVRGRVIVTQGGNGEIAATLTFERGKLEKATETANIRSGPRPICQATKLLDADPIVRAMAEQDLIVMGRAAFPYLDEQQAKAAARLRDAIERIRRKIEANGW